MDDLAATALPALEPRFSAQALQILRARYLLKGPDGEPRETPAQLLWRVASALAAVEERWGADPAARAREAYALLARLEFLPNSPTLMNAGKPRGQLSACFVLPVEDTLDAIFETIKDAARIHSTGGGTGFAFSRLRPRDDEVAGGGRASGPVAFLRVFDAATAAVHQGGVRRGANMGILRVDHPDILEFVDAKRDPRELTHFNVSVAATDAFMEAVERGASYDLINPRTGAAVGSLDARAVWDRIVQAAWTTGDPGLVFIDRINAVNPTPDLASMESTNPCVPGDTWVLTANGPRQVGDLIGEPFEAIVDGRAYASATGFFATGEQELLEVETVEGHRFRATREHRVLRVTRLDRDRRDVGWTPAGELEPGDRLVLQNHGLLGEWPGDGTEHEGYLLGMLLGDGSLSGARSVRAAVEAAAGHLSHRSDDRGFHAPARGGTVTRLKSAPLRDLAARFGMVAGAKRPTEAIERTSSAFHAGFLRGLFDADGSVQGTQPKGVSVRLAQTDAAVLALVQRMLLRLGIASTIYRERRPAQARPLPDGRGGMRLHPCAAQHELVIARDNVARFAERVGFAHAPKAERLRTLLSSYRRRLNRERFVATVRAVRAAGVAPVYDVTVDEVHAFDGDGFHLHNCGELPLIAYESCNLGSIDVGKHVTEARDDLDWERLRANVHHAVRLLDDVIEANAFPLPAIAEVTRRNRKIGLGVMGFADLLIELGIPYASEEALALAERLMGFVAAEATAASQALARERGPFPGWPGSRWAARGEPPRRNATVTTVAPTGTIALLAGCSSGIEPLYAVAYVRRALDGSVELPFFHPALERIGRERGFWSERLAAHVARTGSLAGLDEVPADVRALFQTAHEIPPEWHVRMQAAFQRHVENAVSKTCNLPRQATPEDVARIYRLAYELGCKGITVYRDGSRQGQVLAARSDDDAAAVADPSLQVECGECVDPSE